MIEIHKRDENGKDRLVATFQTYNDLFRLVVERDLKHFGYTTTDRTEGGPYFQERDLIVLGNTRYCYLAYENNIFVAPDRLVGLFRDDRKNRRLYWKNRWVSKYDCGCRRSTYGGWRSIKTTQERRWYHAWDDEEFAPKLRARRSTANLPNSWDDYLTHNDKSWKTQSKRRHQWKNRVKYPNG